MLLSCWGARFSPEPRVDLQLAAAAILPLQPRSACSLAVKVGTRRTAVKKLYVGNLSFKATEEEVGHCLRKSECSRIP